MNIKRGGKVIARGKYFHKNKREGDCQLISIANAYYYLTGNIISNDLYEKLANECGCIAGSCIDINKAFKKFKISEERFLYLVCGNKYLPLEIMVWHKYFGFHSILAVEYTKKVDAYRVTNFRHVASSTGWIFYEDLMHFTTLNPNQDEPRWICRTFSLIR